jgi:thiol-disulfide isomerase/thioredoxin
VTAHRALPRKGRAREWILLAAVALAAGAAGYAYNAWRTAPQHEAANAVAALHSSTLPDLDGKPQSVAQWRGKVVVVNFWATWCAPCREEIPLLIELQKKYEARGLQLVGIAVDQPDKVRAYAAEMGMNFPVLIGGLEAMDLARALGNRAGVLPFTVVLNRESAISLRQVGIVKEAPMDALLSSLL